jgi:tyrosyl-tRNA synthetase
MNIDQKIDVIRSFGEEILTESDLRTVFETKKNPIAYDGFEPSGNPHIAQGIIRAININKLTSTGVKFKMFVADWHAWANNKYGGDLDKIQTCGKYLMEIWKASGMDMDNVEFVWANELVKDPDYWKMVMQIARSTTVKRILRCCQIMGRNQNDVLQSSQILYPCMQCADIFYLKTDIAQLGMDQRKVNVLARELGAKLFGYKPVAVHHHMLMGLGEPPKNPEDRLLALKMSKSKPETAIFMTDTKKQIQDKIRKAYCPEGVANENPVLEYARYLIFEKFKTMKIERPSKFGGDLEFASYEELENEFTSKKLHPLDLKNSVTNYIDKSVEPVRKHFDKNKKAKELYKQVQKCQVTR